MSKDAFVGYLDWFRGFSRLEEPWLLLGKGPTFERYLELPSDHGYRTLGLNNCCRFRPVDLTLILDLHNVAQNADVLEQRTSFLAMPWYPHVRNKPSTEGLDKHLRESAVLRHLRKQGRLVVFNSTLSRRQKPGPGPWVHVRYFSGVAGVSLLAIAGVKRIHTLGMDGGRTYWTGFDKKNLFLNGRDSFDIQNKEIEKLCQKYSLDYQALGEKG